MVYFVGAGSGAVDLITVRGKKLLEEADVVIYAGSLVNPDILKYTRTNAVIYNSAHMTLEEIIKVMRQAEEEQKKTVRLHTGDPSIYGAVREQMDELKALQIPYESCPGVSACFGAAASLNLEYTLPDLSQTLIITRMEGRTAVPKKESIESLAAHQASMAIYLSSGMLRELSRRLIQGGYQEDTPAAIVYKATWPEEKKIICTVASLEQTAEKYGIYKTALVIIGGAVAHGTYQKSRLYAADFETEFRRIKQGLKDTGVNGNRRLHIISFTENGRKLSLTVKKELNQQFDISLYCKSEKYLNRDHEDEIMNCPESLTEWTKKQFETGTAILFISACGIAVRAIAPYIKDKLKDVPVVVMDEAGKYVIPVLSGHFGGANALAEKIADKTGGTAVLTTATDLACKFAVDVFAAKNELAILNRNGIKKISASVLSGEKVTVSMEEDYEGNIPEELTFLQFHEKNGNQASLFISPYIRKGVKPILQIYPRVMMLGIGCRKGKNLEELERAVKNCFNSAGILIGALAGIASIELKKEEKGLCELALKYQVPFYTFKPELLKEMKGKFTASEFVEKQTGVDNVCERAAMASCGEGGSLLIKKRAENGITIALAVKKWRVSFDET